MPAAERKRQIAEATLEILALRGARELTAVQIAREVGIQDGSLFRHFASIEHMVAAAIDLFEERMAESFPNSAGEPMQQLRQFFLHRANLVTKHPHVMLLAFDNRLSEIAGDKSAQQVRRMVERSVGFVRRCLEATQRDGIVRTDVSAEVLIWIVIGVLRGACGASAGPRAKPSPALAPEKAWHALEMLLLTDEGRALAERDQSGHKRVTSRRSS